MLSRFHPVLVSVYGEHSYSTFLSKELDPLSLARDFWLIFYSFLLVLDYRSTTEK